MQTPSESYSEPHTVGFATRGMQMNTGPTMDKHNGEHYLGLAHTFMM